MRDFPAWPKTPRLAKPVAITEKIDGTNGLISIRPVAPGTLNFLMGGDANAYGETPSGDIYVVARSLPLNADGTPQEFVIKAGSRNRWLSASSDNYGFWKWVSRNAAKLAELGAGDHYGEWYGNGIQRGYGLTEKRFALFNVGRWFDPRDPQWTFPEGENPYPYNASPIPDVETLTTVPLLAVVRGDEITAFANDVVFILEQRGSFVLGNDWTVTERFNRPEGACLFWEATGSYMKHFTQWENK